MKKKIEGPKPKFTHLQGQKIVISYFERIKTKKKSYRDQNQNSLIL